VQASGRTGSAAERALKEKRLNMEFQPGLRGVRRFDVSAPCSGA
jgi:hypothetical protein